MKILSGVRFMSFAPAICHVILSFPWKSTTLIEFKYAPSKEANHILSLEAPLEADTNQVLGYKNDARQKFAHFTIDPCVIYVAGNKGFRYVKAD